MSENWRAEASCAKWPYLYWPPEWFTLRERRRAEREAVIICRWCPVAKECLDMALKAEQGVGAKYRYGIFGGMTPVDRAYLGHTGDPGWGKRRAAILALTGRGLTDQQIADRLKIHKGAVGHVRRDAGVKVHREPR